MDYAFGPLVDEAGVWFRLWAPSAKAVSVIVDGLGEFPLEPGDDGMHKAHVKGCKAGARYRFRSGDLIFPDPASRQQEGDYDGPSIVCAPLAPSGRRQPLRPWHETVLCEVHVGTVTPQGTFDGLRQRLAHFRDSGFTALEIMPINEFPGARNWGYDGTLLFAPEASYGSRESLRALVDTAHEMDLCVTLDVVYNHFGEVGNFIRHYAPEWFDESVETPWGPGIDFTQPMVRRFYCENACMWISEFDVDGLRFDSVHEMKTEARDVFLREMSAHVRSLKPDAKLIIENMNNVASWLDRDGENRPLTYTAQWNDDIHHVLQYLVTGEEANGYEDGNKDAIADIEKALADGFVHDGEADGPTGGQMRNEPASRLPPDCFVSYGQNHDQIGNRGDSARLAGRIAAEKLDFLHFVLMLAPQVPLFFMGEEAHLRTPFPFFVDLDEQEGKAKAEDRHRQMREIFRQDIPEGGLPDPNTMATFELAKLDWDSFARNEHRQSLKRFRQLADWRRDLVWPLAATPCLDAPSSRQGNGVIVNWVFEAGTLSMALNPTGAETVLDCRVGRQKVWTGKIVTEASRLTLGAWSAVAWVDPSPAEKAEPLAQSAL